MTHYITELLQLRTKQISKEKLLTNRQELYSEICKRWKAGQDSKQASTIVNLPTPLLISQAVKINFHAITNTS